MPTENDKQYPDSELIALEEMIDIRDRYLALRNAFIVLAKAYHLFILKDELIGNLHTNEKFELCAAPTCVKSREILERTKI